MSNFDDLLTNAPTEELSIPQLTKEEYAAKKQAEREELFTLSDETALDVTTDGGKFQALLDLQARLDRYSAVNSLLVFAQNPQASRLGDFDFWKEKNCSVRPGQTAIGILEPQAYTKEDGSPGTGYNVKKVFDISQVDTRRLNFPPLPSHTERQILNALIKRAPMNISGADNLPDGLGAMITPEGDIFVRKGMGFDDTFRAIVYEMAGYELATDPELSDTQAFCAYSAAYLLCKKYGVDTQAFHFEKVDSVFIGMDAQEIKGELSQIRDAAEDISLRMARQFEAQQKAAKSQESR